nr:hypothetical protein [Synechococcus sp. WH 8020]
MDSGDVYMSRALRVSLVSLLLGSALALPMSSRALTQAPFELSERLESALNQSEGNVAALKALFTPEQFAVLEERYGVFSRRFPQLNWSVRPGTPTSDGRSTMQIAVSGRRQQDGLSYSFYANQRLAVTTESGLITSQEVLSDQSVMTSAKEPLPISLLIPDSVLTGTRYDVDVVVDKPLGDALMAGGLIALTPAQVLGQESPDIQLKPLGGGGLFKSVQAPLKPGIQNWAALLVHPEGVVSVSKQVRVVDDKSKLQP